MKNLTKRSAASRKAWRTRKQMEMARKNEQRQVEAQQMFIENLIENVGPPIPPENRINYPIDAYWPRYKKRALPNPWMQ